MSSIYFAGGLIRSGSTWGYNVCRELLQAVVDPLGPAVARGYPGAEALDEYLRNEAARKRGPVVMKAHVLGAEALRWIADGRAKAIYTFRDPRDCVASDMQFQGRGFSEATARVVQCLQNFGSFPDSDNVLLIAYEEMMAGPVGQIRQIREHLELQLSEAVVQRVSERTSVRSSRLICERLRQAPAGEVLRDRSHYVDPVSLLHDNHLGSGRAGRWRDDLTSEQQRTLNELFQEWLPHLGY